MSPTEALAKTLPRTAAAVEHGIEDGLHIGAQVCVSRAGRMVADAGIGKAHAGLPLMADALMLWMSTVKPVTAVAIGQQWERGRLEIDDPVVRHIPEFGSRGKQAITIRHLLTHTAGIPSAARSWNTAPWDEIFQEICDAELEAGWVPGRNAGYHVASAWYVLGEIVRRLDGRSYSS